jgi:endonuclease YncB( thermonuclease family)
MKTMIFPSDRSYKAFKMTGNLWTTLILAVLVLISMLFPYQSANGSMFQAFQPKGKQTPFMVESKGVVDYVVDGDTIIVKTNDGDAFSKLKREAARAQRKSTRIFEVNDLFRENENTFTVRIGSINTPESKHPIENRNTPEGIRAAKVATSLLLTQPVIFQCYDIGFYGRPICAVQTDQFDFGAEMIRRGFSDYANHYGNHPLRHEEYRRAALER